MDLIPTFDTLVEYARYLIPIYKEYGWNIDFSHTHLGVSDYFKNGKPKKTNMVQIMYCDRSSIIEFDHELCEFIETEKKLTGRERPWRVDSKRFNEGKTFGQLHSAILEFHEEVKALGISIRG